MWVVWLPSFSELPELLGLLKWVVFTITSSVLEISTTHPEGHWGEWSVSFVNALPRTAKAQTPWVSGVSAHWGGDTGWGSVPTRWGLPH